jgi:hypothetical protein
MAKGYWINAGTMSGSQGEYAHVDLTDGSEIVRVLLQDEVQFIEYDDFDTVVVVVGRVKDEEKVRIGDPKGLGSTIWNNRLEVLSKDTFYKVTHYGSWYGTSLEEAKAIKALRLERYRSRQRGEADKVFENGARVVLPYLKRHQGFKTLKVSEITDVRKSYAMHSGQIKSVTYTAVARGKRVLLW